MGIAFSLGEAVLSSSPRKDILKILRIIAGAGLSIGSLNFAEIIKSAQVIGACCIHLQDIQKKDFYCFRKDSPIMKNKTKIDFNAQYELTKISSRIAKMAVIMIGFIFIISGFFVYAADYALGIGSIVGGIGVILLLLTTWNRTIKKSVKKMIAKYPFMNNSSTFNDYEFTGENVTVVTTRDDEQAGKSVIRYTDIFKVVENDHFLFLFINPLTSFILNKDNMTEGSIDDVNSVLRKNVAKYKKVK
jgi:hypothetical protein